MGEFVKDAVDHKGDPANRKTTGGWASAAMILGIEISERLSTMAIVVNITTYSFNTMHLHSATASNMASNISGSGFLLALFGGILADSFLGRYWTIAISTLLHALGTCLLAITNAVPTLHPSPCNPDLSNNCEEASGMKMALLYLAVYSAAVGMGGIKSSVSGFATDQFDQSNEKEKGQMVHFFNRFYLFICIGTLLAVTAVTYIIDTMGGGLGYGICSALMVLSSLKFLLGTKRYRYKERKGSPIVHIMQVLVAAIRKRKENLPSDISYLYDNPTEPRLCHTDKFRCLDKAAILTEGNSSDTTNNQWILCSITKVEEVKMMIGLTPFWVTAIPFWTIHAQLASFAVQQASSMERSMGKFTIPAASYYVFFIAAIMITGAIYDRLILPLWKKYKGGQGLTNLQKIGIGIFFSILGMATAVLVERKRLQVVKLTINRNALTLPITAFMLLPQFILIGIGETFMYSGQLDFFITEAPKSMKAISTGLFLSTIAMGMFGSSILVIIIKKVTGSKSRQQWLAPRINDGRLDYFYGLLAVLAFISLCFFLIFALKHTPLSGRESSKVSKEGQDNVSKGEEML